MRSPKPSLLILLALASPAACLRAAEPEAPQGRSAEPASSPLLGELFPIEASASFPAAVLHWMDSLAGLEGRGLTAGKTIQAHRMAYELAHGPLAREDEQALRTFSRVRNGFASRAPRGDPDSLTLAFFEAETLEEALEHSADMLAGEDAAELRAAVEQLARRYQPIWRQGEGPRAFLRQAAAEPRRDVLARFLLNVARFLGVSAVGAQPPRVVLVPVADGFGTHAQAVGRCLLIEVRPGEGLIDETAPIVHEVVHFLFQRVDSARLTALSQIAEGLGGEGEAAFRLLHEALPTAIAQGMADLALRPRSWSAHSPWYHIPEVDAYAKRIFPLLKEALATGGSLDGPFLRRLLQAYPVTPRSP